MVILLFLFVFLGNVSSINAKEEKMENNLALKENGTYVLASSFANYNTFYPDNLIDGDENTVWRSWDSFLPQWVELRWDYPLRINKIAFREKEPSFTSAYAIYYWQTDKWSLIKKIKQRTVEGNYLTSSFPEVTTDRLKLVIEESKGEHTQISELEIYGPAQPIVGKLQPYWKSWYIWYPEPDKVHKASSPRYFRKTFTISNLEEIKTAFIQLRSNDYYKVFINGDEAGTGSTNITPIPVRQFLREGKNAIAVVADLFHNPGQWGWGELLVELSLHCENKSYYICSDASWKSYDKLVEGWQKVDFNDDLWKESAIYVQPPEGPWGKIPYFTTGYNEQVILENVLLSSNNPQPGETITVNITFKLPKKLHNDYIFILESGEKAIDSYRSNWALLKTVIDPVVPTSHWSTDDGGKISVEIVLPDFSPDGKMPITLKALSKQTGTSLDMLDKNKEKIDKLCMLNIVRFKEKISYGESSLTTIEHKNGTEIIKIGNKDYPPLFWRTFCPSFEKIHHYSNTGIHLYYPLIYPYRIESTPEYWKKNFDFLNQQIENLLRVDPEAYFLPVVELRPSGNWLKQFPEERLITASGNYGPISYTSKKYELEVMDYLKRLIGFLNSKPYASRIIGYLPFTCGVPDSGLGGTEEDLWQKDRTKLTIGDYNPQAIKAFQDWLREKYSNSLLDLRKAWKDEKVTFETAKPIISELVKEGENAEIFRDPTKGAMPFDYFEFISELLPEFYFKIAKLIKEETKGKALVLIHYGYMVEHLRGYNSPGGVLQNNDFYFDKMLDNSFIDGYCGAISYAHRLAGNSPVLYFPYDSIRLHKKLYVIDGDYRTFVASPTTYGRLRSIQETIAVLKRDLGSTIIGGSGIWFSDMSSGRERSEVGWFMDADILKTLKEINEIYESAIGLEKKATSEIAVFVSGRTYFYHDVYYTPPLYNNLINRVLYQEMPKIGAPFDIYMMNDLKSEFVQKQYKMYVFINPLYLSDEDIQNVEKLKRDGKTLFWFYAPGYVNKNAGLKDENISKITGINVKKKSDKEIMEYKISNFEHPITEGLTKDKTYKIEGFGYPLSAQLHPTSFGPVFCVDDKKSIILGNYPDGEVALALKDFGTWKSVYCAVPYADSALLRNIAKFAGVHLYCDQDVVMDADSRFLMLHNGFTDEKTLLIRIPEKKDVYDLFSKKLIVKNSNQFSVCLPESETYFYLLK